MRKNRYLFIGLWLLFITLLIFFPGFECRGLAIGLWVGVFPLMCFAYGLSINIYPLFFFIMAFIFSGLYVVLFSWILDKFKWYSRSGVALLCIIVVFSAIYTNSKGYSYDDWRKSSIVSAAVHDSSINYNASREEFAKLILIPRLIAGAQIGLYITLLIYSISAGCFYKKQNKKQINNK